MTSPQAVRPLAGRRAGRAAVLAAGLLAACGGPNPYYDPARAHHRPDGFVNTMGPVGGKPFGVFLRWQRDRIRDGLPKPPSEHVDGYAGFPVVKPDLAMLRAGPPAGRVSVTWIGHATLLVQIAGRNVLIDPHFSDRASPLPFAGPIRRVPLPADLADLPRIDVVLISHSHYDHLDAPTVRRLQAQPGGPPLFVVPLGLDLWLRDAGVTRVERLDWWDVLPLGGLDVHLTPAQHWSARAPWDHNRTLWGGFVVRSPGFTFWYSGDTGYSPALAEVGRRFPGIDLAAIPVGAYEPRWFMQDQHVNPEEAVRIFLDVNAREAVGVHWGTFELTDEPLDAPMGELPRALDGLGVARERFGLWRHGETRTFGTRER